MFCSLLICFYFHKKETYPVLEGVHDNVFFSAFHLLYHQFILIGMTLYFRKYNFPLKTDILMSRFKQYIFFLIFAYCPSGVFLTTTSILSYFFSSCYHLNNILSYRFLYNFSDILSFFNHFSLSLLIFYKIVFFYLLATNLLFIYRFLYNFRDILSLFYHLS